MGKKKSLSVQRESPSYIGTVTKIRLNSGQYTAKPAYFPHYKYIHRNIMF